MSVLLAAFAAAAVQASPAGIHQFENLAISPGGDQVAAVESDEVADAAEEAHGHVVVRRRADGSVTATYDPCPKCRYAGLAWSPDGHALAFVASEPATRHASLQVAENGALRVATRFNGLLATPRWSPDGKVVAVLATADPHKESGATQAGAARVGEIGVSFDERRIATLPASGGEVRFVSPDDAFVYEYDWTPDGRGFVATSAKGDGDNNWWVARLQAVSLDGAVREIAAPSYQMNAPRVSPDGKTVVFIGGLMSDFGSVGGDLYAVPFAGGRPVDITPSFKGSFGSLDWLRSGLHATALVGEANTVLTVDPSSGAVRKLWSAPMTLAAADGKVSLSADGRTLAAVGQSYDKAPAILAGPTAAPQAVTHDNHALAPYASARSVTWKNEGFDVQGWLLAPLKVEPGKTYPMIVLVHGGPSAAHQPNFIWKGPTRGLLDHGYYVFMPNPRGSYGQGEAFTRANIKDFGGGDLRDILAGVDAVEKIAPVDDKRLGVYGHSYGGFMTMWAVTHSQRFAGAVAGAGLANWVSYYGQNGIDQWMVPFFGSTVYDDPSVYDRLSPIRSIKAARTPTFIYVGERDVETPAAQSLEFWHGLQAMGVPTSLVILEGEGHGIRTPAHNQELNRRIVGWFDKYLGRP